ncbi:MAG TPA: glycosyltransferase family 39 protein [Solirubrobacteraceae bacterium]
MTAPGPPADLRGRFVPLLAVTAAGALAIRIWAALTLDHPVVQGDAMTFHQVAQHLADGEGFRAAFDHVPTAEHPPLWELVLAAADLVGGNGYTTHRLIGALIGTLTVIATGLLGRRVAGDAVGVVAAVLAAVNPMLWGADVSLMSEPLYGLLLVCALLVATRPPSVRDAAALGALIGLAALTRGEAVGLLVLLVVPLLWRRWKPLAAAFAACALVIAPWTIRNLVTFDAPVLISTNANTVWIGANCPETYAGSLVGHWSFRCFEKIRPGEDEAQWSVRQRRDGLDYALDHTGRWPAVVRARLARTFELHDFGQSLYLNANEGRAVKPLRWGIRFTWALLVLAAIGAVLLRRRRAPLLVVLAPIALVVALSVLVYGMTRFRFAAEPSLCVLAAASLAALPWARTTTRSGTSRT